MEWQEFDRSLCSGCKQPAVESFDIDNTDAYTTTAFECHACASRERKAWSENESRGDKSPPLFGRFYAVKLDD